MELKDVLKKIGISGSAIQPDFPIYFQIETVSSCNTSCVMCPIDIIERGRKLMTDELFNKISDEIIENADKVRRVTLHLMGEPLLDKKIHHKIRKLKEGGVKEVFITSNGSLLTEERSRELIDAGLDQLDISIDGFSRETYESIRVNLSFDELKENITTFLRVRNDLGSSSSLRLRFTIQDSNAEEYQEFLNYWRPLIGDNDKAYGRRLHSMGKNIEAGEVKTNETLNKTACISPFGTMIILSDGRVAACCVDINAENLFGDVNETCIKEIWRGDVIERFRAKLLDHGRGAIPICRDCNVWADDVVVNNGEEL